ncbi:MAG: molybdate ABC transporter substrate-binding protein [Desulfobacteraceae bacterium]|jgi:molybdate transport system substrate-binding protein
MKFPGKSFFILAVIFSVLSGTILNVAAAEEDLILFAAASTTNAVTEAVKIYETRGLGKIKTSFASSSTLAKQIANGAPADIYLSANKKWMDYLEQKGAVQKQTRFDLLGNRIALIVPSQSPVRTIDIKKSLDISSLLGSDGRLATGDPEHVPAGIYGKQALETLGLWEKINGRIAPMKDVRAALVMVERAETPLGLVYTTDAAISKKVRIAGVFPSECHPPIVYPIAIVTGGKSKAGTSFLNFLKTQDVRAVFIKYGFEVK